MRLWAALFVFVLEGSGALAQSPLWLLGVDELGTSSENAARLAKCLSQNEDKPSCVGMIAQTCDSGSEVCMRTETIAWQALGNQLSNDVALAGSAEIRELLESSHEAWHSYAQARCLFRAAALTDEMPFMVRAAELQCALTETVERVLDLKSVLLDLAE